MASHFLNPELQAPNVREVVLDPAGLAPALAAARQVQALPEGAKSAQLDIDGGPLRLSARRPDNWNSDISWWSADDRDSFAWFQRLFDSLGLAEAVAPHVDYEEQIRLYAGFFVMRRWCRDEAMHVDWFEGDNDAFTLMTPLTPNGADMGLAYLDFRSQRRVYDYAMGKGVVFGDRFMHATAVGETRLPSVFLSFTFGTDKMDRWPQLSRTTARQGRLYQRPDGVFVLDGEPLASG